MPTGDVASLGIGLSLNSAKFQEGIAKASAAMSAFEKSVKPIARGFTKFGKQLDSIGSSLTTNLTLPIVAASAAIGAAVVKMAQYGGEINDMAVRTGFSREALQELKFAADQTGVSMESIEGSTRKLTKAMGEAAKGGKTAETFQKLGIAVKDANGHLRPASEVFKDTLDALKRIPDETTRNVVGMELLGKSAGDLTPLIALGKEGLNAFGKEARDAGLVMSEDAVLAADAFGDKMDKLKSQLGHAGMEIGQAFMPIIEQLISFIQTSVIPTIKKLADWFSGLSESQKNWVVGIALAAAAIGPLLSLLGSLSGSIGMIIKNAPMIIGALSKMRIAFMTMTGPVGLAVGAITLLVGALAMLEAPQLSLEEEFKTHEAAITSLEQKLKILESAKIADQEAGRATEGSLTNQTKAIAEVNKQLEIERGALNKLSVSKENYKRQTEGQGTVSDQLKAKTGDLNFTIDESTGKIKEHTGAFVKERDSVLDTTVAYDEYGRKLSDVILNTEDSTMKLSPLGAGFEDVGLKVNAATASYNQNAVALNAGGAVAQQVGAIGTQMAADVFEGIGEAIGGILTGSMTAGEAMKNLFKSIFDNLKQIGKALIATGIPLTFAVATAPEGVKMIAAGTGVVAAATAGSAVVSSFAEGGLVFGETMALIGEGRGTTGSNPEVVAPLDKLMGFMGDGMGEGSGKSVEFIISGETLRGVLKKNNDSRRFLGNG